MKRKPCPICGVKHKLTAPHFVSIGKALTPNRVRALRDLLALLNDEPKHAIATTKGNHES